MLASTVTSTIMIDITSGCDYLLNLLEVKSELSYKEFSLLKISTVSDSINLFEDALRDDKNLTLFLDYLL